MLNGGYSEKFKELSNDKNGIKFSKTDTLRIQQLAARDRTRKLSLETNRRRRALELKKRLEAQKEAKRREEVLEERRKRQQEATHKFQRLRKGSPRTEKPAGKSYYSTPLKEGVQLAHGSRLDSASDSRLYHDTPNLEDALRLVGGHTNHSSYGSHTAPSGYINNVLYQHEYSQSDNSLHRKYGMDNNGNTTAPSGYHGYSTQATATTYTSSHGRMPVKQFQQDLQDQQRKFLEEQAKSLHEFNEEIMKETTPNVLERSDSLSSLDSLEEQPQKPSKKDVENSKYSVSKAPGPAVTVNYYTQSHFNTQPSSKDQAAAFHITELDSPQAKLFVSNQRTLETASTTKSSKYPQKQNDELQLEETSECDFVSEQVEDRKPMLLEGSSQHPRSSLPRSYADALGSQYQTRTSEAWVPQTSYGTSHMTSGHVTMTSGQSRMMSGQLPVTSGQSPLTSGQSSISGIAGHSVIPAGVSNGTHSNPNSVARNRQFSAKTAATVFTVVPNTNGSNISHHQHTHQDGTITKHAQHISGSPKTNQNNAIKSGISSGKERQRGVQFEDETPAIEKREASRPSKGHSSKNLAKQPVSILKKTISSDQPAKLGGFKVRDSLEITKSSPGRKKSVRWTDVDEYDDDVDDGGHVEEKNVGNDGCEYESEESKDNSIQQQSRPAPIVNGRDKASNQNGIERSASSKSRSPASYSNTSYASSYVSKKQNESPSSVSTPANTGKPIRPASAKNAIKKGVKSGNSSVGKNGTVRAANGLRLDKTPTDDEINWLWDKVRTCLHSRDETEVDHAKVTERPPSGQQPRQVASVSSQYIDGGRITANLRIPQPNTVGQSRNDGIPRWRTNSDSGSYLRRTALLHQRRQHSAISRGQGSGSGHPALPNRQQPVPATSHQGPARTATIQPPNQEGEVTDSLLAFQRAEQLVNDDINEAELAVAMENHRVPSNQDRVPASALSMEEQRILESLDRLNERLRTVAPEVAPYMAITPKPPPYGGGGFRGKRPLSSKQLMIQAEHVPSSSRVRASSADRSNVRINCYQ